MSIRKGTNEAKEYLRCEKHVELLFAFLMLKEDPHFPEYIPTRALVASLCSLHDLGSGIDSVIGTYWSRT